MMMITMPMVHDTKIPDAGMKRASGSRRPSFRIENVAFSMGTNGAARTPVSALSCSTKMAPVTTATTNHMARNGLLRKKASCGSIRGIRSRNPRPMTAAIEALTP
jgi:hypothetical protein